MIRRAWIKRKQLPMEVQSEIARRYSNGEPMRSLRSEFRCGTPAVLAALAAHGVHYRMAEREWEPTPEEIEERAAQVRSLWSREDGDRRRGAKTKMLDRLIKEVTRAQRS